MISRGSAATDVWDRDDSVSDKISAAAKAQRVKDLAAQAEVLAEQLAVTQAALAEAKRSAAMAASPAEAIAVIMHDSLCGWRCADVCGWHYERRGGVHAWLQPEHTLWLVRASAVVEHVRNAPVTLDRLPELIGLIVKKT